MRAFGLTLMTAERAELAELAHAAARNAS